MRDSVVRVIADFVDASYPRSDRKAEFLKGADPWVIAHAKTSGATVVTGEVVVSDNSTHVKIPNVCNNFSVDYIDPFTMMRTLGIQLVSPQ